MHHDAHLSRGVTNNSKSCQISTLSRRSRRNWKEPEAVNLFGQLDKERIWPNWFVVVNRFGQADLIPFMTTFLKVVCVKLHFYACHKQMAMLLVVIKRKWGRCVICKCCETIWRLQKGSPISTVQSGVHIDLLHCHALQVWIWIWEQKGFNSEELKQHNSLSNPSNLFISVIRTVLLWQCHHHDPCNYHHHWIPIMVWSRWGEKGARTLLARKGRRLQSEIAIIRSSSIITFFISMSTRVWVWWEYRWNGSFRPISVNGVRGVCVCVCISHLRHDCHYIDLVEWRRKLQQVVGWSNSWHQLRLPCPALRPPFKPLLLQNGLIGRVAILDQNHSYLFVAQNQLLPSHKVDITLTTPFT